MSAVSKSTEVFFLGESSESLQPKIEKTENSGSGAVADGQRAQASKEGVLVPSTPLPLPPEWSEWWWLEPPLPSIPEGWVPRQGTTASLLFCRSCLKQPNLPVPLTHSGVPETLAPTPEEKNPTGGILG